MIARVVQNIRDLLSKQSKPAPDNAVRDMECLIEALDKEIEKVEEELTPKTEFGIADLTALYPTNDAIETLAIKDLLGRLSGAGMNVPDEKYLAALVMGREIPDDFNITVPGKLGFVNALTTCIQGMCQYASQKDHDGELIGTLKRLSIDCERLWSSSMASMTNGKSQLVAIRKLQAVLLETSDSDRRTPVTWMLACLGHQQSASRLADDMVSRASVISPEISVYPLAGPAEIAKKMIAQAEGWRALATLKASVSPAYKTHGMAGAEALNADPFELEIMRLATIAECSWGNDWDRMARELDVLPFWYKDANARTMLSSAWFCHLG